MKYLILLFILNFSFSLAQSRLTNAEVMSNELNGLIEKSEIKELVKNKRVSFNINDEVFTPSLISFFSRIPCALSLGPDSGVFSFNLKIDSLSTFYPEYVSIPLFSGSTLLRQNSFSGHFYLKDNSSGKILNYTDFNLIRTDTILTSDKTLLESNSRLIKVSDLPEVGFFRSIVEPSIAVSVSAVIFYFFYSVRSR